MLIGIDCHHIQDQRGIERYVLNLLNFFKKERDCNFILYVADKASAQKIPKSDNFKIKILKGAISSTALFQHWLLPRQARKDKIDLLFSPSYFLPIFYRDKTALTIHDIIYEVHPEWFNFRSFWDKILITWIAKKSAYKTDVILTPSSFTKEEIVKHYNISPKKIHVFKLAPDKIFNQKKDRKSVKGKYDIQSNFFILSASLFKRRCILETLIAFKKIAENHDDFQLLILGKDLSGGNIGDLIIKTNKELRRKAIIYINKFIDSEELASLYKEAYAVIYLSTYEGFGLPVIEAMSCGVPAICGNAESLKEISNKNCFWVEDPRKIEEISKTMEEAVTNKKRYGEIKKKGQKRANEFSWKECSKKTLSLLKSQIND